MLAQDNVAPMGDREDRARLERLQTELKEARALAERPISEDQELRALEAALVSARAELVRTDARIAEFETRVSEEMDEMHRLSTKVDDGSAHWLETDRDAARRRDTPGAFPVPTNGFTVLVGLIAFFWFIKACTRL
jgi:chromosome segregation ATPase